MEIIFSKEDGTEFARFADAEDLGRKFVAVCVAADDEITALTQQRDELLAALVSVSESSFWFDAKKIADAAIAKVKP